MNPGTLRERVTLLVPVDDLEGDEYGRAASSRFTEAGTFRARVRERDLGTENIRAGRDEPLQRVMVTLRHRDDVTTRAKFRWRGRTLRIVNVGAADVRHRYLVCECAYAGD